MKLLGGATLFHKLHWEFEHPRPLGGREGAIVHAQQKHVRKLQPLRPMHGHQLHRVSRRVLFEAHRSAGLCVVIQILYKLRQSARFALRFPLLHEFCQSRHVFSVVFLRALRYLQPLRQAAQNLPRGRPLECFSLRRNKLHQLPERRWRLVEGQLPLGQLQDVVDRPFVFSRTLYQAHQIRRFRVPCRRCQHARAGDVVVRRGDQPQVRQHVLHHGVFKNGEFRDHKRNLSP